MPFFIALLLVGLTSVILGVLRLNSLTSQLTRGFGGTDGIGYGLIVIGFLLFILGLISGLTYKKNNAAEIKCAGCKGSTWDNLKECHLCKKPLTSKLQPEQFLGLSPLTKQLEELSQLHKVGVLTDAEYSAAKSKLIS